MEKFNNINDKFQSILDEIRNSDNYKNYKILENEMKNNKKINELINDIKCLQKKAVNLEYNKKDISNIDKEINEKLNILNEIPLYIEYTKYQKIIDEEQILLKEKINNYIEKIMD